MCVLYKNLQNRKKGVK